MRSESQTDNWAKAHFPPKYPPAWHCVLGPFGRQLTGLISSLILVCTCGFLVLFKWRTSAFAFPLCAFMYIALQSWLSVAWLAVCRLVTLTCTSVHMCLWSRHPKVKCMNNRNTYYTYIVIYGFNCTKREFVSCPFYLSCFKQPQCWCILKRKEKKHMAMDHLLMGLFHLADK